VRVRLTEERRIALMTGELTTIEQHRLREVLPTLRWTPGGWDRQVMAAPAEAVADLLRQPNVWIIRATAHRYLLGPSPRGEQLATSLESSPPVRSLTGVAPVSMDLQISVRMDVP
jgi:hypothetical protein